jgi:tRNA G26 N,N-dimethylase Trm1
MITKFTFIDASDKTVPAGIRGKATVVVSAMAERVTWWMLRLQQKVQGEKLQGQVLHHRSGRLTASINAQPTENTGSKLVGSVTGAGGPAWYGQLHEDGGTFTVKAHLRRSGFNAKGELVKLLNHSGSVRAAVASMKDHMVPEHTITFPQRSFMVSSLTEINDAMVADLQQTTGISIQ